MLVLSKEYGEGMILRELAVNVDSVETGDEVDEDVVNTLGNLLQKSGSNLLVGGVL